MAKLSATKAKYSTSAELEEKGAWMTLAGGGRLRIRSQSAKIVREFAQRLVKKTRHVYASGGSLSVDQQDEQDIDLCVGVLITEIDNFEDDDDKPLPYSKDLVREIVAESLIRKQVLNFSTDADNYRTAVEGNSSPSSKQN